MKAINRKGTNFDITELAEAEIMPLAKVLFEKCEQLGIDMILCFEVLHHDDKETTRSGIAASGIAKNHHSQKFRMAMDMFQANDVEDWLETEAMKRVLLSLLTEKQEVEGMIEQ